MAGSRRINKLNQGTTTGPGLKMISIERGGGEADSINRGKTRWLMTDDYGVKCRNFDRDRNKLKKSDGAYPKIYRVLIRFRRGSLLCHGWELTRTLILFITNAFLERSRPR